MEQYSGRYPEKIAAERIYCGSCGVTTIAPRYTITYKKGLGILLNGKCAKCGHDVCRVIED
jgi:ribosomal protein S27AE